MERVKSEMPTSCGISEPLGSALKVQVGAYLACRAPEEAVHIWGGTWALDMRVGQEGLAEALRRRTGTEKTSGFTQWWKMLGFWHWLAK